MENRLTADRASGETNLPTMMPSTEVLMAVAHIDRADAIRKLFIAFVVSAIFRRCYINCQIRILMYGLQ
ncbi:MAG: hypothetical protein MJZ56_07695 [Bacteroidales bacterium]|nr:hypothetical protein [Bacteroidales bacterium]